MNLGVFLPNWIGDVAMATPTLRALRSQFPAVRITGVMRPYVADVLAGTKFLDEQIFYDPHSRDSSLHGWPFLRRLRAERLDTVVLLTNSWRTGLLAWCSGARRRVGYVRGGRGILLTDRLEHRRANGKYTPTPVLDDYLRLAYQLGCGLESPRLELATLPADEAAADVTWKRLALPAGRHVVALNSSGAFGSAKLWPSGHFAELARKIVCATDNSVLVLCGPSEREIARDIVAAADHPRVVGLSDEQLSIGLTKACVRRCRLLVTTDSGPRYFGVAFGRDVVSLFGPTDPAHTRLTYDREATMSLRLECQPCMKRTCPLGHHRCMRELTVDAVYGAVWGLLEGNVGVNAGNLLGSATGALR